MIALDRLCQGCDHAPGSHRDEPLHLESPRQVELLKIASGVVFLDGLGFGLAAARCQRCGNRFFMRDRLLCA